MDGNASNKRIIMNDSYVGKCQVNLLCFTLRLASLPEYSYRNQRKYNEVYNSGTENQRHRVEIV